MFVRMPRGCQAEARIEAEATGKRRLGFMPMRHDVGEDIRWITLAQDDISQARIDPDWL
jgi:hypothetical protein